MGHSDTGAGGNAACGLYQLAEAIGRSRSEIRRARELGILPCPDVGGHRWSGSLVDRLAERTDEIRDYLSNEPASVAAWAQAMTQPRAAVVLDTETTTLGGEVVEIAIIDAASGSTLVNTLVQPCGRVRPEARAVHGISDSDLVGAPHWRDVLPQVLAATANSHIICYNAEYDLSVILSDCARAKVDPGHLADHERWECLMRRRLAATGGHRWTPLRAGHRARDDARAARSVLFGLIDPHLP